MVPLCASRVANWRELLDGSSGCDSLVIVGFCLFFYFSLILKKVLD